MGHRHRIVAAIYDQMTEADERAFLGQLRSEIVGLAAGTVIEVGAGTGRNLPHYQAGLVREVKAVEPDPYMRRRAAPRAAAASFPVEFVEGTAEDLPFPSGYADSVVATLVLCSVDQPQQAVREFRRVLRPGGQLLFIEHIRSDDVWRARLQDLVAPVWQRVAANCHPNRPTLTVFRAAGFEVQEKRRVAVGLFPWIPPIVAGLATVMDGMTLTTASAH
ncbi:MAG: methyltransferase domain-containing protein [Deltaproteobacteria bacterium]|nr:methyltransferase domain-containing protein [Deltaproteobacteria bacterium]